MLVLKILITLLFLSFIIYRIYLLMPKNKKELNNKLNTLIFITSLIGTLIIFVFISYNLINIIINKPLKTTDYITIIVLLFFSVHILYGFEKLSITISNYFLKLFKKIFNN